MQLNRGFLIVFEGIDGVGKTTHCAMLVNYLESRGVPVRKLYEPTHGTWGKKVRKILVEGRDGVTPEEELELFIKDRQENVEKNIKPALENNEVIVMDRYYYSTAAYQGAIGLDPEKIRKDNEAFAPKPDKVFLIVVSPENCLKRIQESREDGPNTFEKVDYLQKVQQIFDSFTGSHIQRIENEDSIEVVHERLCRETDRLLGL